MPRTSFVFDRQRIVVAGEDSVALAFAIATLRHDGHCVTHAADLQSASWDLALGECHLLVTGSGIGAAARADLLRELRQRLPALAVLCLTGDLEPARGRQPRPRPGTATLSEPFTAEALRSAVRPLLPRLRLGSVLASLAPVGKQSV